MYPRGNINKVNDSMNHLQNRTILLARLGQIFNALLIYIILYNAITKVNQIKTLGLICQHHKKH